jgi:16S rRNA (uracil1498-N3)-methyltransferase
MLEPGSERSLSDFTAGAAAVTVAVGPEGGFDKGELDAAHRAGYQAVRLGPRILRTETAGVVALAALQATVGDLR